MTQQNFGINVTVNTQQATAQLNQLNQQSAQVASNVAQPINVNVNIQQATQQVKELSDKVDDVSSKLGSAFSLSGVAKFLGLLTGVAFAMKKIYDYTSDAAHEIVSLNNEASSLGMRANSLKAWETAFQGMGYSAQTADQAIGSIQDKLTSFVLHPSAQTAGLFGMMGIDVYGKNGQMRGAEDVTKDVFKRLAKMPTQQALAFGAEFGFSRDVVMSARQNPKLFDEIEAQKKKGIVTDKEVGQAKGFVSKQAEFGASIDKLRYASLMPLADTIQKKVLPTLDEFAKSMADLVTQMTDPNKSAMDVVTGEVKSKVNKALDWITDKTGVPVNKYAKSVGNAISSVGSFMTNFGKSDGGQTKVISEAMKQGYTPAELEKLKAVAGSESSFQNIPSQGISKRTGKPVAYGVLQYQPSTISGYLKDKNANPMDVAQSIKAFKAEMDEFNNVAKKYNIANSPENLKAYHHLGVGDFAKMVKAEKSGAKTYGDVYKIADPTGKRGMASLNPGMVNKSLPSLGTYSANPLDMPNIKASLGYRSNSPLPINTQSMPSATHSTTTTNIAHVTVKADNPKQFTEQMKKHTNTDRLNSITGKA